MRAGKISTWKLNVLKVIVGFGVLSAAEVKLFDHYKREGLADFWWDNAGLKDMLSKAPHDPGALLIDGYCKRFESKPLEPIDDADGPEIRAVAVASTVGQAKQAFNEVARMAGGARTYGIETAIVLPDENLLVPLLHSVHGVNDLNVTLGYPLRSSGIVSLMHIVARMHHQASRERGVWTYYREDINGILSMNKAVVFSGDVNIKQSMMSADCICYYFSNYSCYFGTVFMIIL